MCLDIGESLRQMRRSMKITQVELAEKTGIKQSTISSIENGINKPAIDTLLLISDALGCTVSELIGQSQKAAVLHPLDAQLLSIFHQLNDTGKSLLISQAESILQQSALRKEASILFNQRSV